MASEEITNETAEQPVEAATPAPVAETPPLFPLLKKSRSPNPARTSLRNLVWAAMTTSLKS